MSEAMVEVATVKQCWRYPVKSFQGEQTSHLVLGPDGIEGDRSFGLIDQATGHLLSAKAVRQLLEARATIDTVVLPDGTNQPIDDPSTDLVLSQWLGREVRLARPIDSGPVSYQMTFGPAGPDRRTVDVPTPSGTFLDVAHVHLLTTASLAAGRAARPDLDWDVRRFRPNLVLEVDDEGFIEDSWVGNRLRIGDCVLVPDDRTLRCAMPMRAQHGLDRAPDLFRALVDLNENRLGLYCSVMTAGVVRVGDPVGMD